MPRFAANLSLLYPEYAFPERFAAAAQDGFRAVEVQFPYALSSAAVRSALDQAGQMLVLINAPAGNWAAKDRGLACLPGREEEFRSSIDTALDYAVALGVPRIHVMAGCPQKQQDPARVRATYLSNLSYAAVLANKEGIDILIEPLNAHDVPGYFLTHQHQAEELCKELAIDNILLQFDVYHCQRTEGDLSRRLCAGLTRAHARIGHIQIAGVPDRHEPGEGEVHYPALFSLLDLHGYDGWVGCEYHPRGNTHAGLQWLRDWQSSCAR